MNIKTYIADKGLSSRWVISQVLGAIFKSGTILLAIIVAITILSPGLWDYALDKISSLTKATSIIDLNLEPYKYVHLSKKIFIGISATLLFISTCYVVPKLNALYSLRKQEARITWTQITFLAIFGIWIGTLAYLLNLEQNKEYQAIAAIIGSLLTWIFQDTIKSVAAFFYLRANGLLKIGDWIEVKKYDIDGMVKTISLTTVTIENWDTTTSAFPTYILHSEHFKNNQKMMEGKTHGRQMKKTFTIDTGWIHPISEEEADRLRKTINIDECFKQQIIAAGKLNAEIFRLYIYHWLMKHPHVSHEPRLIVRWLEQTEEGMPLQIYAFITDSSLAPFEWQQSLIIEHFLKALAWFDLQLYQSPSGYDASNSNVFMSNKEATYRKEQQNV